MNQINQINFSTIKLSTDPAKKNRPCWKTIKSESESTMIRITNFTRMGIKTLINGASDSQ